MSAVPPWSSGEAMRMAHSLPPNTDVAIQMIQAIRGGFEK